MVANGPVRQIHLCGNFLVRQPLCREFGNLKLLRRESIEHLSNAWMARLSRSAEFASCSLAPWRCTQCIEDVARQPQGDARIHGATLAAQPFTISKKTGAASKRPF